MKTPTFVILSLAATLLLPAMEARAAKPPHRLGVTVGADHILVERATPGGTVLLVGYEHFRRDFTPVHRRVQREGKVGGDKSVRFELNRQLVPNSFWLAFDLSTGGYGAATADKRALREAELPAQSIKKDSNGRLKKVASPVDYLYGLVIRPGVGAWDLTVADGGPNDDDRALNGTIEFPAKGLKGIAKTLTDLDEFQQGDIVVVFVPHRMGYFVTEVKK